MLIPRKADSAHWYLKDGTPFYEIEKVKGGMRSTTIRDAFKAGAYRSVTNVLDVLAKPGLVNWRIEQAVLAALTLPRENGEDDSTFAARALIDADEQAHKAAERGQQLHDAASVFLTRGREPSDGETQRLLAPLFAWCASNFVEVLASEKTVLNHDHYYAGRLDLAAVMRDEFGGSAVLDIKTQDVKLDSKGNPKPVFYDEWPLQLSAYSRCPISVDLRPENCRLISLVVDRNRPGVYPKEWTHPTIPVVASTHFFRSFVAVADVWGFLKGGVPGRDAESIKAGEIAA